MCMWIQDCPVVAAKRAHLIRYTLRLQNCCAPTWPTMAHQYVHVLWFGYAQQLSLLETCLNQCAEPVFLSQTDSGGNSGCPDTGFPSMLWYNETVIVSVYAVYLICLWKHHPGGTNDLSDRKADGDDVDAERYQWTVMQKIKRPEVSKCARLFVPCWCYQRRSSELWRIKMSSHCFQGGRSQGNTYISGAVGFWYIHCFHRCSANVQNMAACSPDVIFTDWCVGPFKQHLRTRGVWAEQPWVVYEHVLCCVQHIVTGY